MINISGFENISLTEFEILKKVNCHSECCFKMNIGDDDIAEYYDKLGNDISVDNGEDYLFFGYINNIEIEKLFSESFVTIHAISLSKRLDEECQKRIFQAPDKSLKKICKIMEKDSGFEFECNEDPPLPYPIIQHDLTDFQFAVMNAENNGFHVFVNDALSSDAQKITIGKNIGGRTVTIDEPQESLNIQVYNNDSEAAYIVSIVLLNGFYDLGTIMSVAGTTGFISSCNIFLEQNILKYKYEIRSDNCPVDYTDFKVPQHILLKGIVDDNNDPESKGRITVSFDCEHIDALPDTKYWMPYRLPYISNKGGIIFLPDKGDPVDVIFCENTLTACAVSGSINMPNGFENAENKYIIAFDKYRLSISDDMLSADNQTYKLELNDKSLKIISEKVYIVVEDDMIGIKNGDTEIEINSKALFVKSKDIKMNASDDINLKGDKIKLS